MPAACSAPHHLLELAHRLAAGREAVVGREEADRVVAPVVGQAALDQVALVDVLVHRQQLHGGHAQPLQVLDGRVRGQPAVRAAQLLGYVGMPLREALDVDLVDERPLPGRSSAGGRRPSRRRRRPPRRAASSGAESRSSDRQVGRPVARPGGRTAASVASTWRRRSAGVRVEQQLGRVEPMPVRRRPRPVRRGSRSAGPARRRAGRRARRSRCAPAARLRRSRAVARRTGTARRRWRSR